MDDDDALVSQAREGLAPAFRTLYERHRTVVARLVEAFGGFDPDEVADVVQESFTRAFTGISRLREPGQFRPWLLTIARNRCLSFRHARRTEERVHGELAWLPVDPPPTAVPAQSLAREQERQIVNDLIASMPDGVEKRTVVQFYLDGDLSVRQIAEQNGETKSAVGMRLERFRARFKLQLLARLEPESLPNISPAKKAVP